MIKIVTWNINSVRLRIEMVLDFLRTTNPDILCLQEIKTVNDTFPFQAFKDAGYPYMAVRGMKSYNGVAIISRLPFSDEFALDFVGKQDCRHVAVRLDDGCEIHNFYVPAGGDIPDINENPKFAHKLDFVDEIRAWFANNRDIQQKLVLVGDLNIAPLPEDVWSHKQLLNVVSHTPIEVEKLSAMRDEFGWCDAVRHLHPARDSDGNAVKLYSWWSYRARDWQASNKGRRLDHIWLTPPLLPALKQVDIASLWRSAEKPSDHVPLTVTLE